MTTNHLEYCHQILPQVSRTFALGIDILNNPLRDQVCVSYLICRILDTIEDTTSLPFEDRATLLERAGRELTDSDRWKECFPAIQANFVGENFPGPDHSLCRHCNRVFEVYHSFPAPVRNAVSLPVKEMAEGMAKSVRLEDNNNQIMVETIDDLKQYCHYVAGTVGNMLTNLFSLDRDTITPGITTRLQMYGPGFALGLQLTNIIKGVFEDASRGICYLPRKLFSEAGLTLTTLLDRPDDPRGQGIVFKILSLARDGLDDALEYTLSIPPVETDLRLFCALPLIFAVRTLALATKKMTVFKQTPLKISRQEVSSVYLHLKKISGKDTELRNYYQTEKKNFAFKPTGE